VSARVEDPVLARVESAGRGEVSQSLGQAPEASKLSIMAW
jgi:hypothetical protein